VLLEKYKLFFVISLSLSLSLIVPGITDFAIHPSIPGAKACSSEWSRFQRIRLGGSFSHAIVSNQARRGSSPNEQNIAPKPKKDEEDAGPVNKKLVSADCWFSFGTIIVAGVESEYFVGPSFRIVATDGCQ
jgi:hypothetical protein